MYHEGLQSLRELGDPAKIRGLARQRDPLAPWPAANAHIHLPPNFSTFQSVGQAIELACQDGLKVLGASNYYDYSVYQNFLELAEKRGIFPLFGLEAIAMLEPLLQAGIKINDPGNPGKMYICGKGITRFESMTSRAQELLSTIRVNDAARMAAVVQKLAKYFAVHGLPTNVTEYSVKDMVVRRHGSPAETVYLQERHVAQAFQEALSARDHDPVGGEALQRLVGCHPTADAVAVQNAIRSALMKAGQPAFVAESFVSLDQAVELILELGGIPCYPVLADGADPICGYEDAPEKLVGRLKAARIFATEFIPPRNKKDVLVRYVRAMREAGMVVTAGTEHNTLDMAPLQPACAGHEPVPTEVEQVFREGACVIAAHQYLTAHGEFGFVDSQGVLNPAYKSDEERIHAFSQLGAVVVDRFCSVGRSETAGSSK